MLLSEIAAYLLLHVSMQEEEKRATVIEYKIKSNFMVSNLDTANYMLKKIQFTKPLSIFYLDALMFSDLNMFRCTIFTNIKYLS